MGGYAHLATLVKRIRAERAGRTLLLDGGDTLQGSATALWSRGEDMVRATNQLGVEVFTAALGVHLRDRARERAVRRPRRQGRSRGDFVAHNVSEAGWGDPVFHPYTVREVGGVRVGVIGQAFPYTPVAHPRRFVPGPDVRHPRGRRSRRWSTSCATTRKADLVVLLSHNGIAVDLKLAARVSGLDVILGGHTHDGLPGADPGRPDARRELGLARQVPEPPRPRRPRRRVAALPLPAAPVLSRTLPEDPEMARLIREIRAPHEAKLGERLAVSESLLYRRGNFNGTFDEMILDALLKRADAEVAFSPGFRWGITIVPGQDDHAGGRLRPHGADVPEHLGARADRRRDHHVMEDVADNLFHPDPYYRQGGDMVRLGGLTYAIDPGAADGPAHPGHAGRRPPLEPARRYKATGWASLGEADGPPAWDVVADHCAASSASGSVPPARARDLGTWGASKG